MTKVNNNLAAKIYSSGNDLLVTRADDSDIKYRLISSKSGLKLNKYVNDVGSTLWEAATNADLNSRMPTNIIKLNTHSSNIFTFKSKFDGIVSSGNSDRQSVFMFLSDNGEPVYGLLTIMNKGIVVWSGTGNVTATMANDGRISVTLQYIAYDTVILISGEALAK